MPVDFPPEAFKQAVKTPYYPELVKAFSKLINDVRMALNFLEQGMIDEAKRQLNNALDGE